MLYLINFLFQKSFRPRFLSIAELLHEEGFKVGVFSYLKLESFQNLKHTWPATGMENVGVYLEVEKKGHFQSTSGIFSWVIHKLSRYHPTESFPDCLIEHMGLSWGEGQPWLRYQRAAGMSHYKLLGVLQVAKTPAGCHVRQEGRKGKPFLWRRSLHCFIFSDIHELQTHEICGVYIPPVAFLHYCASVSLLKGN